MNRIILSVALFAVVALFVSGCASKSSDDTQLFAKKNVAGNCAGSISCVNDQASAVVGCSSGPGSNGLCAATCPSGMNRVAGHCYEQESELPNPP